MPEETTLPYAISSASSSEKETEIQILVFQLGGDTFAINLFDVKEIVEYSRITPLPGSKTYIKGIIDLRGEITTIIDLKTKMGISSPEEHYEQSRIIVIDASITKNKTGILVDDVTTVLSLSDRFIDKKIGDGDETSYILGVIKHTDEDQDSGTTELIIWLDISRMLQDMGQ